MVSNSIKSSCLAFSLAGLLVSGQARAQLSGINKEIAVCSSIKGPMQRLSCFDDLSERHSLSPSTKVNTSAGNGNWNVRTSKDPMTDKPTVTIFVNASNIQASFGKPITLVARCDNNHTEVFIIWNDFLGTDSTEVGIRIGKSDPISSQWSLSTNNQASFYPGNSIELLKNMMRTDTFIAQTTPYDANEQTAVFDTQGLAKAVEPLRKTCGW